MSVDRIISESLSDKAAEFTIGEYRYEEMLKSIEEKAAVHRSKTPPKLLGSIRRIITALHIKDFIEIALVALVLIAVPVMVRNSNNTSKQSSATEATGEAQKTSGTLDPKTIDIKQASAAGNVVMITDLDAGGVIKINNIEKLDKFVENSKAGQKDSIRIVKFTIDKTQTLVNSITDIGCDGSRIEAVGYDLNSDKTAYKASNSAYYEKIIKTETEGGIRYALYEKAQDAESMGLTLLSYVKAKEEKANVKEDITDEKQNSGDLKLSPAAVAKYLKDNNYEVNPTTSGGNIITLPDSFNAVKGDVKIGAILKDRNQKSKAEANLDFSGYLGKSVYMFTAIVTKDGSKEKSIVILAFGSKVIGLWTDTWLQSDGAKQPDYNVFSQTLGEKPLSSGTVKKDDAAVDKETSNLKLSPEACDKYLKANNYEVISKSGNAGIINLPHDFNVQKGDIKIGAMLKDRNEKSKNEAKLDFSSALGKTVFVTTTRVRKDGSQEKYIVMLALGDQVIGLWTDSLAQTVGSEQTDFTLLVQALKE